MSTDRINLNGGNAARFRGEYPKAAANKGYIVEYYVGNTGYVQYCNKRTEQVVIYKNRRSAVKQRRRIERFGTPNLFSGVGRVYSNAVIIQEVTIR